MIKKNSIIEITITDQGKKGDGIGYINHTPILIPNTLPGDTLECRILRIEKRRMYGKKLTLLTPSPQRVRSKCSVSEQCGGCQLHHQRYSDQLIFKETLLKHRLRRFIECEEVIFQPILPSSDILQFRNKMQFSCHKPYDEDIQIGLYATRTHRVIPIINCPIMSTAMNGVLTSIKDIIMAHDVAVFNETTGSGHLRHITLREAASTGQIMVILTTTQPSFAILKSAEAINKIDGVASVYVCLESDRTKDQVLNSNLQLIAGKPFIENEVMGLTSKVSPLSFQQAHSQMTETLYRQFIKALNIAKHESIIELYCGTGILALALAKEGLQVLGVDDNPHAILDAKTNAKNNNLTVQFICQKAEVFIQSANFQTATVVMDPPRKGCHPDVLNKLIQAQPHKIGLMACSIDTLGRDLRILINGGYMVTYIQAVDMFCHTPHLEIITILQRQNQNAE